MAASPIDKRKAADKAGYDVDMPPDSLTFEQFKALLLDGVATDDRQALIGQFIDDVKRGNIAPAAKTATGFNWPVSAVHGMGGRCKQRPLNDGEITKAESGDYPGAVVQHWDGKTIRPVFTPEELEAWKRVGGPPYDAMPKVEITYQFDRDTLKAWLDKNWTVNKLLAGWLESEVKPRYGLLQLERGRI